MGRERLSDIFQDVRDKPGWRKSGRFLPQGQYEHVQTVLWDNRLRRFGLESFVAFWCCPSPIRASEPTPIFSTNHRPITSFTVRELVSVEI